MKKSGLPVLEPKDKLDTVAVNGLEDVVLEWDATEWRAHEDNVRRLRQRIFKAAREQDWPKVRNLQKMMLRSWSNTLVGVRRATQVNAGRKTAGIDGQVTLTSPARMELAVQVHRTALSWQPLPVRRVNIPKADGKTRPLGIPVIADRCHQARVRNALEPEWEARFEPRSYGFRPGRSCQDAIEAIFNAGSGSRARRVWVLDADLAAAFDNIDHSRLLASIGSFPARGMIRDWLKAGVFEAGKGFAPTEAGTPQGGVSSPLLLNVALHGLEEAAGVRYYLTGTKAGWVKPESPVLVRYADDMVALCHSRQQAEQVKAALAGWLAPRGLVFNEDKTAIVHLDMGFDFLGFTIRRYRAKLVIKPSKAAVHRVRRRLSSEMRALRGSNGRAVLERIAPIVRGWSVYYRGVVSSKTFKTLDSHVWKLTYKWAKYTHPGKPKYWIVGRYFGRYNPYREDKWVFGDRDSGAYLPKFSWTKIVRHQIVPGSASPDDPSLVDFWTRRRRRNQPPLSRGTLRLIQTQKGRCDLCGGYLLHADHAPASPQEWEQWVRGVHRAIARYNLVARGWKEKPDGFRLVHIDCYRRETGDGATQQTSQT